METQGGLDLSRTKVHRARLILENNWSRLRHPTIEEVLDPPAAVLAFCRKRGIVKAFPRLLEVLYRDFPVVARILLQVDRRRFRNLGQRAPVDHLWIRVPLDPATPHPKEINQGFVDLLYLKFGRKSRFMTMKGYDVRNLKQDGYKVITK